MHHPSGKSANAALDFQSDWCLKLEFHGSEIILVAELLAYRELDDVLGPKKMTSAVLADQRRGKKRQHLSTGLPRQSIYNCLAGYADDNDADRLAVGPAMRPIVYHRGLQRAATSTAQMAWFATECLTFSDNLRTPSDLPGLWIDRAHDRQPAKVIVLDMGSSVSPTWGDQEGVGLCW